MNNYNNFLIQRRFSRIINIKPNQNEYPLYYESFKSEFVIKEGEGLFIPYGWYHYVISEDVIGHDPVNSEFVKKFNENIPKDFEAKSNYFDNHKSTIFVNDLTFCEIYFGEYTDFDWAKMNFEQLEKLKISWNVQTKHHLAKYKYLTDNNNFAVFCAEVIRFIEKLNITNNPKTDTSTLVVVENTYPEIFTKAHYYYSFLEYTEKHIIDFYKDYSFLYQYMKNKKFITDF
jgi:hypothetical protein